MKKNKMILASIAIIFTVLLLSQSLYIVEPDQLAIVKRFGAIVSTVVSEGDRTAVEQTLATHPTLVNVKVIDERGLLFKLPFIDTVEKVTSKYLTYTSRQETINTSDNRKLDVQMYAQYSIENPALYKMRVGSDTKLNQLLDDNVYPVVIQSANKLTFDQFFSDVRMSEMMIERQDELNKTLIGEYGIRIADIGIYRKNFPQSNIASIEDKMSLEIQKESEQLIAEGDAYYIASTSETDRIGKEIIAKAVEESAIIRATADKAALEIYQASLKKDIDFYSFIQRMNIFKEMENQTIFLGEENDFLSYLNGYN